MRYSVLLLICFSSCTYNEVPSTYNEIPYDCSSNEPSFKECIKPIIDNHCVPCHKTGSANGDLSTYESLWEFTINGDLINRISKNQNEAGFMPLGNQKLDQMTIDMLIHWKENDAPNN